MPERRCRRSGIHPRCARATYNPGVLDGESLHRSAAALRIALVGQCATRVDIDADAGPVPLPSRTIDAVEARGRRLNIVWDDGLTLHSRVRRGGAWHLYRADAAWRRSATTVRAAVCTRDWIAVCFGPAVVETYREFDPRRHPSYGRLGPDVAASAAAAPQVAQQIAARLADQDDPGTTIADALVDLHVVRGVGTMVRSEALWATGLHPAAELGRIRDEELVALAAELIRLTWSQREDAAGSLRVIGGASVPSAADLPVDPLQTAAVFGRTGRPCPRCRETIGECTSGGRALFWCPGCQRRHDPAELTPPGIPMDPHPAVSKFLADLPWRRGPLAG